MSTYALDAVFRPRALALVGGSPRPRSVGRTILRNLLDAGFPGPLGVVNRKYPQLEGVTTVARLAELPFQPELVVLAVPPTQVARAIASAAAAGARAVIVMTSGMGRGDGSLQADAQAAARAHGVRIVGPNCLGVMAPHARLNASFSAGAPLPGDLALISQSGAVASGLVEWGRARGIGFSAAVSLGDAADVDGGDLLDWFAQDPKTRAILLYIESIRDARKFMSAARAAARAKPVVVVKSGRHAQGAQAAATHTGAVAGSDAVYDAAFRRAGLLRVLALDELFAAAKALGHLRGVPGRRLGILTNGGGLGVLAVDRLIDMGGSLATLDAATCARLDAVLPPSWSRANPVDVIGDADADRYAVALEALLASPDNDAVLAMHVPTALSSSMETAAAVAALQARRPQRTASKPVLGVWVGGDAAAMARLDAAGVPSYSTEADAVRGFMYLVRYREAQQALMETPPSLPEDFEVDVTAARALVATALAEGRSELTPPETAALLAAYAIPLAPQTQAAGPQPLRARQSKARELVVGLADDPVFGPMVVFGRGGTAVEVIDDKALALPPLDLRLAHEQIARTRVSRILKAYRDVPAADERAVALVLVKLAQLAADIPQLRTLEINPLLADADGVLALDARATLSAQDTAPQKGPWHSRLVIRPYPREWERMVELARDERMFVRPVRPEDEAMFRDFFARISEEDLRLRFFSTVRHFSHEFVARLTQLDYARAIALVALGTDSGQLLGVVHLLADANFEKGEYSILVRSDLKGYGIGWQLMRMMVEYARSVGLKTVEGQVLRENATMLKMCRQLGFAIRVDPDDPTVMEVTLDVARAPE